MMGWDTAIYILIASLIISALATPRPHFANPSPTAFEDIDFPQPDEGTPQGVIFGDCWSGDWTPLAIGKYRTSPVQSEGTSKK